MVRNRADERLRQVAKYRLPEIRQGIVEFLGDERQPGESRAAVVYLLIRVIFRVPARGADAELYLIAGGHGSGRRRDQLWPYRVGPQGHLVLASGFLSDHAPDLDMLTQFDLVRRKYGLRERAGVVEDR